MTQDETPTQPVTPVHERRAVKRNTAPDPNQPTLAEVKAALEALEFYNVELGAFGHDAVRRMLVAAAIVRRLAAGREEVRERVAAHLAHAGSSE